jgi:hypothetical protein
VPDQFDEEVYVNSGLRYASTGHQWHGVVSCTDEVLLAAMGLAGTMFRNFAIPATPEPVVATVGSDDLLGQQLWVGDISVPYPEDAPQPYQRAAALSATDFLKTVRYAFDASRSDSSLSRPLIARVPPRCSPVNGLTYDCQRGVVTIDTPAAKAIVGSWGLEATFDDGIGVQLRGPLSPQVACFGLASTDGMPLVESKRAVLVLTTHGENRGRTLADDPESVPGDAPIFAKQVKSWGWGPPDIARPAARITLPGTWRWRLLDFQLHTIADGEGEILDIPPGTPVFLAQLTR